eukprot:3788992-Ditylum_brightwellii.AAC.1
MTQAHNIIDQVLASAMHDMQTTIVMMLAITACCKQHVNDNSCHANKTQHQYDYTSGQKVLNKVHNPIKLGVRTSGLYIIEPVHVNGTLLIELCPGVTKCINMRGVIPFCSQPLPLISSEDKCWAQTWLT